MLLKTFPCALKYPCSLKDLKYFIHISRKKGSTTKQPFIKVFAASSAPSTKLQQPDNEKKTSNKSYVLHKSSVPKEETQEANNVTSEFEAASHTARLDITSAVAEKSSVRQKTDNSVKLLDTIKQIDLDWHIQKPINLKLLPTYYKSLSKFRLSGLVVLTTLAGYGMAPGPFDITTLVFMTLGTGLTSAAANSINQILEVPYDSQMTRTKNRVLIRCVISPLHAALFATCSASLGLMMLYCGTNGLTTILGATNLLLYTSVYTPMKRFSILNTWLGSVVGAIPPLMGWAAATGTLSAGALLMAVILYSWQFPHFNALSWNMRPDYSRAGYRMTSVVNPELCRRVAFRHSVALLCLCTAAPLLDLTTWTFAFDSLPFNCYLLYRAWKFKQCADGDSSRQLFRFSLVYLPALMFLMLVGKKYAKKEGS